MSKKIGIVTGGGDCPGLNTVIHAVAKTATMRGWETLGILGGFDGLLEPRQFRVLDYQALGGLLTRGAPFLAPPTAAGFRPKLGMAKPTSCRRNCLTAHGPAWTRWASPRSCPSAATAR